MAHTAGTHGIHHTTKSIECWFRFLIIINGIRDHLLILGRRDTYMNVKSFVLLPGVYPFRCWRFIWDLQSSAHPFTPRGSNTDTRTWQVRSRGAAGMRRGLRSLCTDQIWYMSANRMHLSPIGCWGVDHFGIIIQCMAVHKTRFSPALKVL